MDEAGLKRTWQQEEDIAHIHGWDFSHIHGRYREEAGLCVRGDAFLRPSCW